MVGKRKVWCSPSTKSYKRKCDGATVYYESYSQRPYVCKLHHPDSAEVAEIRQELASGAPKVRVAAAHGLGSTPQRLNRLLKKWAVMYPEEIKTRAPSLKEGKVLFESRAASPRLPEAKSVPPPARAPRGQVTKHATAPGIGVEKAVHFTDAEITSLFGLD